MSDQGGRVNSAMGVRVTTSPSSPGGKYGYSQRRLPTCMHSTHSFIITETLDEILYLFVTLSFLTNNLQAYTIPCASIEG